MLKKYCNNSKIDQFNNCAQIVPVKVKYLQTFPNETKNSDKNTHRINWLKILTIRVFTWKH